MKKTLVGWFAVVWASALSLYADYSRMDFIKCNATATLNTKACTWINTGYTPTSTDRIEMKVRFVDFGATQNLFCSRDAKSNNSITAFFINNSGMKVRYDRGASGKFTYSTQVFTSADDGSVDHVIVWDGNEMKGYVDASSVALEATAKAYTGGSPMSLFASHNGGTGLNANTGMGNTAKYRFYWCRVYNKDGKLLHNFVPARDNSKTAGAAAQCGVWDTVTEQFLPNQGTVAFDMTGATAMGALAKQVLPIRQPRVTGYGNSGVACTATVEFPNPGYAQRAFLGWSANAAGGDTTNSWEHVDQLNDVLAAEEYRTITMPAGARFARVFLQPILPNGLTAVDYLHSTGQNEYVDTGFKPSSTTRVDYRMESESPAVAQYLTPFGSRIDNTQQFFTGFDSRSNYWYRRYGTVDLVINGNPGWLGEHTISLDHNQYTLDGVVSQMTRQDFTCTNPAYIFAVNNKGVATQFTNMKLFSLALWDDGALVRNYIPCVNSQGTAALYEAVSGTLVYGQGETSLTAGGEAWTKTGVCVADLSIAVKATWTGEGDGVTSTDNANWHCVNVAGETITGGLTEQVTELYIAGEGVKLSSAERIPHDTVAFGPLTTLGADCDWRGLGTLNLTGKVDVAGHTLRVADVSGNGGEITDGTGWTELDYAWALGTQNVVTDIVPDSSDRIEAEYYLLSTSGNQCLWCARGADTTKDTLTAFMIGATARFDRDYDTGTFATNSPALKQWATIVADYKLGMVTINGILSQQMADGNFTPGSKLCLFASHTGAETNNLGNFGNYYLRYFKLYAADGTLKLDLIPRMRNADSAVGMYDRVSDKFYVSTTNQGLRMGNIKSSEGAGTLIVDVPQDSVTTNTEPGVLLNGGLAVRKEGAGTWVQLKQWHCFARGFRLAAGRVELNSSVQSEVNRMLGGYDARIEIDADGILDNRGVYDIGLYHPTLLGGTLANSSADMRSDWGNYPRLTLKGDATVNVGFSTGIGSAGTVDLAGHTLELKVASGKSVFVSSGGGTTLTNGTIRMVSGGVCAFPHRCEMRTVDLEQLGGALNVAGETNVRNYLTEYDADWNAGAGALNVYGTFTPKTDYFYGCTLQDGATLDLSTRATELPATSAFTAGRNVVSYAPGAHITVNLGGRTLTTGTRIVAWNEKPSATFAWSDPDCAVACAAGADGLYYGANPNSTEVDHATWTGAANDGDLRNPANWSCSNLAGVALAGQLPTPTSAIKLGANTVFNFTSAQWLPLIDQPTDAENKAKTVCSRIPSGMQHFSKLPDPYVYLRYSADDFIYLGVAPLSQLRDATWTAANLSASLVRFDGWFKVEDAQAGAWTLRAKVDDYVGVFFDNVCVVSNGTECAEVTGACEMTAGWHRFTALLHDVSGGYGPRLTIGGQSSFLGVSVNGAAEVAFEDAFTFGSGEVFTWQNIDMKGCVLGADCDVRGLDLPIDGTIDLNGHSLCVNGMSTAAGVITNSNEAAVGTLRVSTPGLANGAKLAVNLAGNVKLVKEGAGVFTITGAEQTNTVGAEVAEGTLRAGVANAFGAADNTVLVQCNGILDVAAKTGLENYNLILAGGGVMSSADAATAGNGFKQITLTADSTVPGTGSFVLSGGDVPGVIDFGGYTLAATINAGKYLYISQTTMTNGLLRMTSGGHLAFDRAPIDASTVDFDVVNGAMGQKIAFPVRNYINRYTSNYSVATAGVAVQVLGTFTPEGTHFDNAELQDGSTLDLSGKNETWSVTSQNTYNGAHNCTFRSGSRITVDCHGRELALGDMLIAWSALPRGVAFKLDAASAAAVGTEELTQKADGLYVGGGLTWKGGDGDLGDTNNWQTAAGEVPDSLEGTVLNLNGNANVSSEMKYTLIASTLKVNGAASFTTTGGLCLGGFEVGAAGRLVIDPLAFGIRLLGVPRFADGAKIALASKYANYTKGRFLLMEWDFGVVDPASVANLFDPASTAAGTAAQLTVEVVGEGGRLWLDLASEAVKPKLNVAFIGDGITVGSLGMASNFRIPFVKEMVADGYEVITKGFRTTVPTDLVDGTMPDAWIRHSADSGESIGTGSAGAGYLDAIANVLEQAGDVDIIVLALGINDLATVMNNRTADATLALWSELVRRIQAQKPHAKIVVLNVGERENAPNAGEFNAKLAEEVAKGTFGANRVFLVDEYALLPRSDAANWGSETATVPTRLGMAKLGAAVATAARAAIACDSGWETGVVEPRVTTSGAEQNVSAAERAGFTRARAFDIAAHNVGKAIGTSIDYEEFDGVVENIGRVAWYLELKRPDGNVRWLWAACDAWGERSIHQVGVPLRLVSQNAVTRLRVKSNMPGIADTADGVYDRGNVEFWPGSYSGAQAANMDAPGEAWTFDWNDTCTGGTGYGSMQLHRFTPNGINAGEVLFAFNGWKLNRAWELGLGSLALNTIGSMDWTFTGDLNRGADFVAAMSANAYEVARLEIWTMPLSNDEVATATWTNAGGDGDLANPSNWNCTNALGVAVANGVPGQGSVVSFVNTLPAVIPAGVEYAGINVEGECTLAADVDLRGHGPVNVKGVVKVNGHKLYLERLVGGGHIAETQEFDLTDTVASRASSGTTFLGGVAANLFNNNFARNNTDNTRRVIVEKKNLPMVVDYNFGTATTIDAYRVWYGPLDLWQRGPKTWTLEGSSDGSNWTVVDSRDNVYWQNRNYGMTFSLAAPVTYSRFRFKVTDCEDANYMEFVQLEYGRERGFGELHIDVPAGTTVRNDNVILDGQLKVVKEGEGTLVMAKYEQYFWSFQINAGTVKGTPCNHKFQMGRSGAPITIEANAKLDMAGAYEMSTYTINLNGGTLANSSSVPSRWTKALVQNVHLGADSTVDFNGYGFCSWSYATVFLDLNGHTLTCRQSGDLCYMDSIYATEGTIKLAGRWEVYSGKTFNTPNTRIVSEGQMDINGTATFGEYVDNTSATVMRYSAALTVTKRFMPNTDRYRGCTLADGVTIDLTGRTTMLNTSSKLGIAADNSTTQTNVLFVTEGRYTVDVHGRQLHNGDKLIGWNEGASAPANYDTATFVIDPVSKRAGYRLKKEEDGVYVMRDFTVIFLR